MAGVEPAAAAAAGPAGADLPETAARAVDPSPEVLDGKHKLSRRWTIIHGAPNPSNPKDWKKVMTDVVTVGTAEDLIAALAALETPSSLIGRVEGHQLFVFQEGARPDWKDPHVKSKGGRWDLPLRFTSDPTDALAGAEEPDQLQVDPDQVWRKIVFAMVTETFDHASDIVGLALERKRDKGPDAPTSGAAWMYRLALWVQTAEDLEIQAALGSSVRTLLDLPEESLAFCSFRREDRDSNPRITI
ncbi:hypothetical protein FNF29_05668 [Cafeteria roenbergensis]|nr:hypothetical protein FNF29_05668 [Cafeteria roenbergensis]KAA0169238.1 hypothetical protein FNF28_02192 [Cafeteria roenbergensis]|eukprot:KAA0149843.1 hypothetical protein FNF29_05668 [Cafeteria roenbergensis]